MGLLQADPVHPSRSGGIVLRPTRILGISVALCLGPGALFGQSDRAEDPRVNSEAPAGELVIEPWQEDQILDKARIAEESYQRLFGLAEAGNPHRRPGTVLESGEDAASTPELHADRRDRALRTFASREIDWSAPAGHASASTSLEPSEKTERKPKGGQMARWFFAALFLAGVLARRCRDSR